MKIDKRILGDLFGVAVGDALGVPVEFVSREDLRKKPVANMKAMALTTNSTFLV